MNDDVDSRLEEIGDNPAKRIKVQDTKDADTADAAVTENRPEQTRAVNASAAEEPSADTEGSKQPDGAETEASQGDPAHQKPEEEAAKAVTEPENPPNVDTSKGNKPTTGEITSQDEPKTSGPVSSIGENQDFNFDSMFDDPDDTGGPSAGGINFDMDLGTDAFTNSMNDPNNVGQANKPSSLDSLLPGLETYANQTGDDLGMNFDSNTGMDGTGGASTNIFDLPDLGDSTFDDLLMDDSLGGGMGSGGGDDMLNDDSMMNMGDLDSFFN